MPSKSVIEEYLDWFADAIARTFNVNRVDNWETVCCVNLNQVDHEGIQSQPTSHLWRFRPDALVIRRDFKTPAWRIHLLTASSSAISLKDVGIMNGFVSVTNADFSICISPEGISNEVRLLQADCNIRDRLFVGPSPHRIGLVEWSAQESLVVRDAMIPIESTDWLISQRFQ